MRYKAGLVAQHRSYFVGKGQGTRAGTWPVCDCNILDDLFPRYPVLAAWGCATATPRHER